MRKNELFYFAMIISVMVTWLIGCGGDEETEKKTVGSGISYMFPSNGASDIPTTTSVMVIFSDEVVPPSMANFAFTPGASGNVSYDPDNRTMIFKPSSPFVANSQYTMKIDGVTTMSGEALSSVTVDFTTSGPDTKRPELISSFPENGQEDIGHDTEIILKFSEPVHRSKLTSSVSLQPRIEPAIEGWFYEWSVMEQGVLTIFPPAGIEPLAVNKDYTLIIPKNSLVDLSGNSALSDSIIEFKTLRYPVERVQNLQFPKAMVEETWVYRVGKFGGKWAIFIGGQRVQGGPSVATASFNVTASADGEIHENSIDYWEAEGRTHTINVTKGNGNRLSFSATCDQVDDYYRLMFTASSRYLIFQFSGVSKDWIHIGRDLVNPSRTPFVMEN
jgi:hypothetical protein